MIEDVESGRDERTPEQTRGAREPLRDAREPAGEEIKEANEYCFLAERMLCFGENAPKMSFFSGKRATLTCVACVARGLAVL